MKRRQFLTRSAALGAGVAASTFAAPVVPTASAAPSDTLPSRAALIEVMNRVDSHWIGAHPNPGGTGWARATYFNGLIHHYRLTREQRLLDYAIAWGNQDSWDVVGRVTTRHADNQCAGQAYLDLFEEVGGADKLAAVESSVSRMLTEQPDKNDDWWWCDALHMAMPVFVRLGELRGDNRYWVRMYRLYHYCKRQHGGPTVYVKPGNQSESSAFWYRGHNFQVDGAAAVSPNGRPVHWSRGNGWVMAAHAKVLKVIPHNDKRGPEYIHTVEQLATELRTAQQADGFWYLNLSDPQHFGGPETSGTAFFAFGIAGSTRGSRWTAHPSLPCRSTRARRPGGTSPGRAARHGCRTGPVTTGPRRRSWAIPEDFGVGAFLMAGSEIAGLTT